MYIVVWVEHKPELLAYPYIDHYTALETLELATLQYVFLVNLDSTYSASICSIVRSTDYQPTEKP